MVHCSTFSGVRACHFADSRSNSLFKIKPKEKNQSTNVGECPQTPAFMSNTFNQSSNCDFNKPSSPRCPPPCLSFPLSVHSHHRHGPEYKLCFSFFNAKENESLSESVQPKLKKRWLQGVKATRQTRKNNERTKK